MSTKKLRSQLLAAVAMVLVATIALGSSTFAWFASNNSVKAENMSVNASADVEFLEIQNVGVNFDGGSIAVDATNVGSTTDLDLKPVTPFTVANLAKEGSENTAQLAVSSDSEAAGYGDGFIWTWTTAQDGTAADKGAEATWTRANFASSDSYYLLNNFKFRTSVNGVTTDMLYAKTVTVTGLTTDALDEAVRVLVVGENGMQMYDVGEGSWTYYNNTGASVAKNAFTGLINTVGYQADDANGQAVKVFIYYEGDDARLFTANINSMAGVTVTVNFSVDATAFAL